MQFTLRSGQGFLNLRPQVYDLQDKYTHINNFVNKSYHHFIRGIAPHVPKVGLFYFLFCCQNVNGYIFKRRVGKENLYNYKKSSYWFPEVNLCDDLYKKCRNGLPCELHKACIQKQNVWLYKRRKYTHYMTHISESPGTSIRCSSLEQIMQV